MFDNLNALELSFILHFDLSFHLLFFQTVGTFLKSIPICFPSVACHCGHSQIANRVVIPELPKT